MTWSVPSLRNFSSFSSDDEVAITRATAALANCKAKIDTPPVPCVRTQSPGVIPAQSITAIHTVIPAQASVAASTWL